VVVHLPVLQPVIEGFVLPWSLLIIFMLGLSLADQEDLFPLRKTLKSVKIEIIRINCHKYLYNENLYSRTAKCPIGNQNSEKNVDPRNCLVFPF
jgi:hypothetical protein